MESYDWIIGICYSDADGVKLYRFRGDKNEMINKLLSLIAKDRENNEESWYYGCECRDDIRVEDNGLGYELYGYGCYYNYYIDYTAKVFAHIDFVQERNR